MSRRQYDPGEIEPKWVARWEAEGLYVASDDPADPRERFFAMDMFPYPSGDLHMGHAEAFSGGDTIARFRWMQGYNVLHPIGWDAFGLPAENAAIKRGIHPKEWTAANIAQQRASFKRIGMSFDWSRQFNTCDPRYYRWTQWLFLQLFDKGLAYRKLAPTNWCPNDQTVLANEQVINGHCERCGTAVVRKDLTQWFFRITDYAQRLLDDLEPLEATWPDRVVTMQRNWIGRSEGAEIEFEIAETGDRLTVFTTRPDTLWGVTFFVFAPEHGLVTKLAEVGGTTGPVTELQDRLQATPLTNREQAESREGLPLGVHAVNPVTGEQVPCFVAPYVLMEYGTGAVMGVPAHDQRDFEFARKQKLPIRVVIQPEEGATRDPDRMTEAYDHEGVMVNSGPFNGVRSPDSIGRVVEWLEEQGKGKPAVSYRLRDWLISRQRYWGAPIPIIHCPTDGEVGVPVEELPVLLPDDVDFRPGGESPLARHEGFVNVTCPSCGGPARRDTDTMDTFVDSSWYFLRYCSPHRDDVAFDVDDVQRWMPVDQYTGGVEHAILHLLYSRFVTKALHDLGYVSVVEPFSRMLNQGQVIYSGASMSKSKGNLVEPMPIVERFGADTMRLTMLFAGPFEDDIDWMLIAPDPSRPPGVYSWLRRAWRAVIEASSEASGSREQPLELTRLMHRAIRDVHDDFERYRFNTAISKLMVLTNEIRHALDRGGDARAAAEALVQMIAPLAPFVAEELWREVLGHAESVHATRWPAFDPELAREERATLVVQVDGKVRERIDVDAGADEVACREAALASERVQRALDGREVSRIFVRPPKLVSIVTAAKER
ncbi:MAG: leucine--tRNA ligase [Actinomycetota bacterium]